MTYQELKQDPEIRIYIRRADETLSALGFTEHSFAHVCLTAERAGDILEEAGFSPEEAELARIAGLLHDIGNLINSTDHSQSGALLAFHLLEKRGFSCEEIATVVSAIGNHDEGTGVPVNAVSAALILADKSDVRRSRTRENTPDLHDIHDRVNFSALASSLHANREDKIITLRLTVDPEVSSVMDYFQIFT